MNKFDKNSIHKGQPNGCPLLFIPIILTIFIAILPACSKKCAYKTTSQVQSGDINNPCEEITQNISPILSHDISTPQAGIKKTHYKTFVNQARNIDISTPVGSKLEKSYSEDEILFFVYHGNQDIKKVISFYKRELEILGWDFKDLSTKQEGLFICNKSSKTCVVSIRPKEISGSIICITITNKLDQN
ncbi:MAG: hypothetical protein V1646_00520 [bacterium]